MNDSGATSGLTDDNTAGGPSSPSPSPSPSPSLLEPTPPAPQADNRRLSLVRGQPVIRRRSRSVLESESDSHHHRRMQSAPVSFDKVKDDSDDKGKRRASSIVTQPPPYDALPPYDGPAGRTDDEKEKPAPALDLLAFPQITALVLHYAAGSTYAPLRATCKALHARVNGMMYAHVEVKIALVDPTPPRPPPLSRFQAIVRTIQATGAFLGVTTLPPVPESSEPAAPEPTPTKAPREPYLAVFIVAPRLGNATGLRAGARIPGLRWDMAATSAHAACVKRLRAHTRIVDDGGSLSEHLDGLRRDEAAMLRLAFGSARIVRNSAGVSVLSAPTQVLFRNLNDGVYVHRHVPERASRVVVHIDVLAEQVARLDGAVGEVMLPGPRGTGQREVYAVFSQAVLGVSPDVDPPGILRETIKDALQHISAGAELRYTLVGLADIDPALLGMWVASRRSVDERHEMIRNRIVEYAQRMAPFARVREVTREQVLALFNLATHEQFRAEVGNELYSLSTL